MNEICQQLSVLIHILYYYNIVIHYLFLHQHPLSKCPHTHYSYSIVCA